MTTLESSIIRIMNADSQPVGAGFLVAKRLAVTCAHVVDDALGRAQGNPETPLVEFSLDFPLVAAEIALMSRVVFWDAKNDIAGLELIGELPRGAKPARLVSVEELWGHTFRAFGFPAGYDGGVWASGVLRGNTAEGWIHIEDIKETGFRVQHGFSGGGVWDEQLQGIIGMVVAAERAEEVKAAFCIPAKVLVSIWPEVEAKKPAKRKKKAAPKGGVRRSMSAWMGRRSRRGSMRGKSRQIRLSKPMWINEESRRLKR